MMANLVMSHGHDSRLDRARHGGRGGDRARHERRLTMIRWYIESMFVIATIGGFLTLAVIVKLVVQ